MMAYEKALDWQELFDLAVLGETDEEDLTSMGYRVAGLSLHNFQCPSMSSFLLNNFRGACIQEALFGSWQSVT